MTQILKHATSRSEEATMEPYLKSSSSEEEILTDHYMILKTLGQGSFAEVKLALHRHTGVQVAVKILEKGANNAFGVTSEVEIAKALDHPNIIRLFHVIETREHTYLVMEHAAGGDLADLVGKVGGLREEEARPIFTQMACAVNYCHENGIAHRDIKLDNVLLDGKGHIKLCDFGMAIKVTSGQKCKDLCGTLEYCAPELFMDQEYDVCASDIWSMGVVLYVMLTAEFPFEADTDSQMKENMLNPKVSIPCKLSLHIKNLIMQLFTVDFRQRPTIHDIMGHQWLQDSEEPSKLASSLEMSPSTPNPSIVLTMRDMGYNPEDIRDSLREKTFNNIMATYLILKHKSPQGYNTNHRNKPVQPGATTVPAGPVTITRHRRITESSLPTLTLLAKRQLHDDGERSRKGGRSHSMPATLCCQQKGMDPPSPGPQYGTVDAQLVEISLEGSATTSKGVSSASGTSKGISGKHLTSEEPQDVITIENTSCMQNTPRENCSVTTIGTNREHRSLTLQETSEERLTSAQPQDGSTVSPRWKRVKRRVVSCVQSLCCCLRVRQESYISREKMEPVEEGEGRAVTQN